MFIILGETGEYSSHSKHIVGCVESEAVADELVEKLNSLAREFGVFDGGYQETIPDSADVDGFTKSVAEIDPKADADYTGTRYWAEEIRALDGLVST